MHIIKEIIISIVNNSIKIDHLEITMGNMDGIVFDYLDSEYFLDIFNEIPSIWFTKISKLEYDGQHLLKKFQENAYNINSLSFGFHTFIPDLIPSISSLISIQNNLVDLDLYLGYNDSEIIIFEIILTLTTTCVHSLKSLSLASGGSGIVQNVKELEMLSRCNHLERLQLRNVEFTIYNNNNNFLFEFSNLISLELFDVRMVSQNSEEDLVNLIKQIMKNSKLISLDLEPFIGDKYCNLVESIPHYCSNLTELTLKINDTYENTIIAILTILPLFNKLRILRITEDWGGIQLDGDIYINQLSLILPNQLQFFNITGLLFSDKHLNLFLEKCCSNLKQVVLLLKNYDEKYEQIIKSYSLERNKIIEDIFVSIDSRSEITINWK
ncbi:14844_t:CDS:1 [Dentiscutata heterogama]|uniref:14844_t:CDS:1 n=1 Tax=Dentiscutata heterogama TaxID=1316150 RepID=A0ACA9K3P8_9GLOM|nr:14844_t:CDS:1 [Dentiscutata heterogama]